MIMNEKHIICWFLIIKVLSACFKEELYFSVKIATVAGSSVPIIFGLFITGAICFNISSVLQFDTC